MSKSLSLHQASLQRETPSGRLRINAPAHGARVIAPLVPDFLRRSLEMEVDLVTEGRLVAIVAKGSTWACAPPTLFPAT